MTSRLTGGLVDAYRQPKRGFAAVVAAVKAAPKVAPSATPQAGQQKPSARTIAGGALAEGFEFAGNQALLGAYSVRKKGASSFRATLEAAGGTSTHLLLAFVPEDFGAWLYLARTFTGERDWSKYRSLRFSMKSQGPLVNLSPFVLTANGSVLRGAATVTKNDEWQDFRLDLQALFHDFPFEKTLGRAANPVTTVDLRRVTGLGIKINDVANFEQIGQTTNVRLDDLVLEP